VLPAPSGYTAPCAASSVAATPIHSCLHSLAPPPPPQAFESLLAEYDLTLEDLLESELLDKVRPSPSLGALPPHQGRLMSPPRSPACSLIASQQLQAWRESHAGHQQAHQQHSRRPACPLFTCQAVGRTAISPPPSAPTPSANVTTTGNRWYQQASRAGNHSRPTLSPPAQVLANHIVKLSASEDFVSGKTYETDGGYNVTITVS